MSENKILEIRIKMLEEYILLQNEGLNDKERIIGLQDDKIKSLEEEVERDTVLISEINKDRKDLENKCSELEKKIEVIINETVPKNKFINSEKQLFDCESRISDAVKYINDNMYQHVDHVVVIKEILSILKNEK